ncbi:hypothetical protein [Staphylococcus aureus]|uniref:hypothetical protein n=2 Tax=Staphylococcus aureus TaxID=1280 RepID=UPI0020C0E80C|nr:hypothetical protein [Staphylococcus aureus]
MIKIYYIDNDGYHEYGNYAYMIDGDAVPDNYVVEQPPAGYLKPRYVGGEWIDEAALPIEERPPVPKTIEERLDEIEARLDALEGN